MSAITCFHDVCKFQHLLNRFYPFFNEKCETSKSKKKERILKGQIYIKKEQQYVRPMSAVPRLLSSVLTESHEYRMSRSIPSLWLFLAEFACFFFCFFVIKGFSWKQCFGCCTDIVSFVTDTSYGFFKLYVNRRQLVGNNSYQNKPCSSNLTAISSQKNRGPILF